MLNSVGYLYLVFVLFLLLELHDYLIIYVRKIDHWSSIYQIVWYSKKKYTPHLASSIGQNKKGFDLLLQFSNAKLGEIIGYQISISAYIT